MEKAGRGVEKDKKSNSKQIEAPNNPNVAAKMARIIFMLDRLA